MKPAAAALLLALLTACAHKRPPLPPAPVLRGPAYAELQPGWQVRVVTPILKSGGFLLKTTEQQESGNTITLTAGDEFQGYETAIYAVGAQRAGGVRIALQEVTLERGSQRTHPPRSFAPRLNVPRRLRHVRLLYSLRVSSADHNMAVLAARDSRRLAELTERVQAAPATNCARSRNEYCEWIPAGVAVRAERPDGANWKPAN